LRDCSEEDRDSDDEDVDDDETGEEEEGGDGGLRHIGAPNTLTSERGLAVKEVIVAER